MTRIAVSTQSAPKVEKIQVAHSSGKQDRAGTAAFDGNVRRLRKHHTIVTRTEGHRPEAKASLQIPEDGWGVWQPRTEHGLTNCSIEWDQTHWKANDRGLVQLTDIQIATKGGFVLPPSMMPWALLDSRFDPDLLALISVSHNNLDNTAKRAQAWLDEAETFRAFQMRMSRRLAKTGKRVVRLHTGDINKNYRLARDRDIINAEMLKGTGLKNLWGPPADLPRTGTFKRTILDHGFSNRPGDIVLLPDDESSDHRPIRVTVRL